MIRLDQRPPENTYSNHPLVGLKTHGTFDGRFHGEKKSKLIPSGIRSKFDGAATITDAELSRELAIPISNLLR